MTDPPTLGEVIRRLDALQITTTALLATLQTQYVSKEHLDLRLKPIIEKQTEQRADIDEIEVKREAREKSDRDWRRQVILVVLGFALTSLGGLAVGVTQLLS